MEELYLRYQSHLLKMKQEASFKKWLYIDITAKELLNIYKDKNLEVCNKAMLSMMLEGDTFLITPKKLYSENLVIRYYVDNLNIGRRHIY